MSKRYPTVTYFDNKDTEPDIDAWDDFILGIAFSNLTDVKVVVQGTLGLWNGTKVIYPVVCKDLSIAILKCVNNADSIKIELENGIVKVSATHHDGTNNFTIQPLSKKGLGAIDKIVDTVNPIWVKKFVGYLF